MRYSLFIDDERAPSGNPPFGDSWVIVRSVTDAIKYIKAVGFPTFITFDHDLGENELTGMDFAKWLVEQDINSNGLCIPKNFKFDVHSQNPPGAANIKNLLSNYLHYRNTQYNQQLTKR
jgi:hypothetical protein